MHKDYLTRHKTHAGIIVMPDQRHSIGEKVRRLASFISRTSAEDMINIFPTRSVARIANGEFDGEVAYIARRLIDKIVHPTRLLLAQALVLSAINPVQLNGQMYSA